MCATLGTVLHLTGRQLALIERAARGAAWPTSSTPPTQRRRRRRRQARCRPACRSRTRRARWFPATARRSSWHAATCSASSNSAAARASISSRGASATTASASRRRAPARSAACRPGSGTCSGRASRRAADCGHRGRQRAGSRPAVPRLQSAGVRTCGRRSGSVVSRRAGRRGGRLRHRALRPPRPAQPLAARLGHRTRPSSSGRPRRRGPAITSSYSP